MTVLTSPSSARASGDGDVRAVTPAIEARGVSHRFRGRTGDVDALDQIDLAVPPGELLAILGPSGCGKSTLLRALSGLLEPTTGQVSLAGVAPAAARVAHGIGWLAQDDGLLPWLSVTENVALPGRVGRRRAQARAGAVAEILAHVGLVESARRYPHELSGGMRQRAALARALVAEPSFLFLDEPFASLDELTRERLGDLLLEVRATHRPTSLLVTHSVVEAVRLADRVIVMSPRPARVLADVVVDLPRPRRYDQAGFGAQVQALKGWLNLDAAEYALTPALPRA
jgi:NitT/TauT family transport system ATP-binding protein